MKHIRKIVSITYALQDKFGWSIDEITDFITDLSFYETRLRQINEDNPYNNLKDIDLEIRNKYESELIALLKRKSIPEIVFPHSVLEVPFKISLGYSKYANHRDGLSFVIDL